LGGCKIVSEEDSGEFFSQEVAYKRPDFRILTNSDHEFFVEVKNFHQRRPHDEFVLKAAYVESLKRYTEEFRRPLFFAIYWSRWRFWTLNPITDFTAKKGSYVIAMGDAGINDHKCLLGDYMVGIRKPLIFRMYTDPSKPRKVQPNGEAQFTIKRATFLAGGEEVSDSFEQRLAWFFFLYGPWEDIDQPVEIEGDEIISIDMRGVRDDSNPDERFLTIGYLSSMISRQFDAMTVEDGKILRLAPKVDPDKLGIILPPGFTGSTLHIWRFLTAPQRPAFDDLRY
jgi:hypothetical protein